MNHEQLEDELVRRAVARTSLTRFAQSIDVPGKPVSDSDGESMFNPIETSVALHHRALLGVLERVFTRDIRQATIFMPPGSAKSTYTSVVYPAYAMGKRKGRPRATCGSRSSAT